MKGRETRMNQGMRRKGGMGRRTSYR
jgi:hypothetical protein